MHPGPAQLARTAGAMAFPPGSPRPPLARRQRRDQRTQPPPAIGIRPAAGPAAAAAPKMSVADAGIVPGDESGSLTTR